MGEKTPIVGSFVGGTGYLIGNEIVFSQQKQQVIGDAASDAQLQSMNAQSASLHANQLSNVFSMYTGALQQDNQAITAAVNNLTPSLQNMVTEANIGGTN